MAEFTFFKPPEGTFKHFPPKLLVYCKTDANTLDMWWM